MQGKPNRCGLGRRTLALAVLLVGAAGPVAAEGLRPQARPVTMAPVEAPPADPVVPGAETAPVVLPEVAAPATAAALAADPAVGPETSLPLPRFVSLKAREGNARRGPSLSHRVDWVFVREDMPLQITGEYENWRRVVDRDGMGGWVHYSLLSGARTVIVDHDMQPLYARADETAPQTALLEAGVIAWLRECEVDWCWISAGGYRGWAPKWALWGVTPDEVRD